MCLDDNASTIAMALMRTCVGGSRWRVRGLVDGCDLCSTSNGPTSEWSRRRSHNWGDFTSWPSTPSTTLHRDRRTYFVLLVKGSNPKRNNFLEEGVTSSSPFPSPLVFRWAKESRASTRHRNHRVPAATMSLMLVDCSGCRTPLQLPPGAKSIRCALCQAVTYIPDPRGAPAPAASQGYRPPAAPSPGAGTPWGPPPTPHGRKRAVICGISYRYSRHELKGCINDAKCMRYLLINRFDFPESSIIMLTGAPPLPSSSVGSCLS